MTPDEEQVILREAAGGTLKRISEDRTRTSSAIIKDMLGCLEKRLLDPQFNTSTWLDDCRASKTTQLLFHSEIGFPPGFYLWDNRMEIAARLFQDTDLSIQLIADLIGFSGGKSLSRAFERWAGLRPTVFRKKMRIVVAKLGPTSEDFNSTAFLSKVINGKLEPPQALELLNRLRRIYATQDNQAELHSSKRHVADEVEVERCAAEDLWGKIKNRAFSIQRLIVRHQLYFETRALFDLLLEKSLEEGRKDRQRGVQLTQLALASLDGCADALGDDLPNCLAQGLGCLGNAYCLAGELSRAEQEFSQAEFELKHAGPQRDPLVEAEVHIKKAKMRWYQRLIEEATELTEQALAVYRAADQPVLHAQALVLKAGIHRHLDEVRAGISDYREALVLLTGAEEPYLSLCAHSGLANCHRLLGEYTEAEEVLAEAETLCEVLDFKVGGHQVRWITGLVKQGRGDLELAEHYLEEARSGLAEMGEMGYTAIVLLDIAILYAEQGRSSKAADPAIEALPLLDALQLGREAMAGVKVLRDAIEAGELTLAVLKDVRAALAEIDRELHGLGAAVDAHE